MKPEGLSKDNILDALPENYVLDNVLDQGGFGQVVKCFTKDTGQAVAVKLPFHMQDTKIEIALLEELMEERMDQRNIVRFIEAFDTRLGRAMVFELLDMSLWDLVDKYDLLPLSDIFIIVQQVATALDVLRERSMVHSDLKMDNVMVVNHTQRPLHVKLIDFGLTMPTGETGRLTVHHAMYRPPEVILGSGWDEGLDVWCLGLIMSYLWLGINLFPDVEYEALRVMHKLLGPPPEHILNKGSNTINFYQRSRSGWNLRTREDIKASVNYEIKEDDGLESFDSLTQLITDFVKEDEVNTEPALDLLKKLLDMDMNDRITPKQILQHPAICHEQKDDLTNSAHSEEEEEHMPLSCLEINDILPKEYKVIKMLAIGKFGQFVKCKNKSINKFVTVKVPYSNNRTQREVRLLQKITNSGMDHQNIVTFVDSIQTSYGKVLVMECLDMNLSAYIDKRYPLPLGHIRSIVKQTVNALQVLEYIKAIHTGVTAENIFICSLFAQTPTIKLADFGSVVRTKKAKAGMRVQQLAYRAPEVILGLPFNQSIDIWSLGCTLVQMVTRVQMFSNESEFKNMETMVKLLGLPNSCDLDKGLRTREFFKRVGGGWALKTLEEFEDFPNFRSALTHLYFERCPSETKLLPFYMKNPKELTECLDLAESMLYLEESDRITAAEIMEHDFIIRSESNKAELQEAPVISPRVIMVKPASPENIIEFQELDDVQKESPKVLMSREKAHRSFNMTQQKNRRSGSSRAEVQEAPVSSHRVIMVKPARPENTIRLQEGDLVKRILMSKEKARKTFDVIQQKDRRSESNKAELQEAPVISPRVIMVKPASPENIIEFQELDDVQKESPKVLMSREKAHRSFNMTQQKNRRSGSSRAEVQEAPVSSHRVIMVKPARPENTIRLQEGDLVKSVTSVELHSAERTTQRDPIQDQQQSDSRLNMETKAKDREPAPIQTPTSTRCDAVDERLEDRPKRKLWIKRTAKVQPLNDSTLPPTEDDFVPKKKRKNIFRRAFSLLKRCSSADHLPLY
uniref:Protein kinase domain-containing protein n=1 Tax=Knipowitschia caucasica TaxID=637954 RepID=A0AAV2J5L4_KNICA